MGLFDGLSGNALSGAVDKNRATYQQYQTDATNVLDQARKDASGAIMSGVDAYTPLAALGQRYNAAGGLALDALGVNGADGNTRAVAAYRASPGYQFATSQALDAATRAGNAMGATGNTLDEVTRRAAGYADQDYGNWLGNLGGYSQQGLSATSGAAQGQAGGYYNLANMYGQNADVRAGVLGNAAGGIANSNMQAAQGATQASSAFWKGLMDLAGNVVPKFGGGSTTPGTGGQSGRPP
jgi:hypothetical protein